MGRQLSIKEIERYIAVRNHIATTSASGRFAVKRPREIANWITSGARFCESAGGPHNAVSYPLASCYAVSAIWRTWTTTMTGELISSFFADTFWRIYRVRELSWPARANIAQTQLAEPHKIIFVNTPLWLWVATFTRQPNRHSTFCVLNIRRGHVPCIVA